MLKKTLFTLCLTLALTACATNGATTIRLSESAPLADFAGRPAVILFAGTYCGHCQDAMPEYAEKVWEVYKTKANLWVNVIDKKEFPVKGIAQGYNSNLNYNEITGDNCRYVPSWVVMDKNGEVALKSCGSEKNIDDMAAKLAELVSQ